MSGIPNESLLVKLMGDGKHLSATVFVADKEINKLKKDAAEAEGKVSGLGKAGSNIAGMIAGKAKDTGLGSFIGEIGEGTTALSAFAGPATIAAGAIVGIGSAAVATGAGLFALAKEASDYGSEIADAQAKTGLASDSLSALRYQANLSGSDFGAVSGAISKFSKLVGEAATGSKEAKAKLEALGIDPQDAMRDLDGAMGKAFKTINDAKPGVNQMTAAQNAFGKSGADLIPTIRGMNGDFAALKKQAEDLGVVLSEADVMAADEFGDTLDTLKMQATGAANNFAYGFMPKITSAMRGVSGELRDNKDVWREWGEWVGEKIELATRNMQFYLAVAKSFNEYRTTGVVTSLPAWQIQDAENQRISAGKKDIADYVRTSDFAKNQGMDIDKLGRALLAQSGGAGDDYVSKIGGTAKKKEKTEAQKTTWNSSTLAEFARNQGFKPGDGFAKTGHNEGSLHGLNRALDIGLNASNTNKTVNQIVQMMENSIKAGIRVVDERVRPKDQKKWTAAHVHLEENDNRASSFNPNLDYGGKLEYLKALDAERLKGKGKSLADALGIVTKEEVGEGAKALADYAKQLALVGVTTQQGRVEIELMFGAYKDLDDTGKAQLLLAAGEVDAKETQTKAIADLGGHLENLGGQYDEINGIQKTATGELEKQLAAYAKTGNVIDPVIEANARNKALMIDMQGASVNLADASAEMTERYKAERDAAWDLVVAHQELKNAIARETGGREETAGGINIDTSALLEEMNNNAKAPAPKTKDQYGLGDFTEGLLGGNGNNLARFQTEAEAMKAVYNDLESTAGAALGSMIEGGAQLLEQWMLTGEMSGEAIAQMTASIIAGVASQAGVKAIFEVAEGLAAAANPFTAWQAPIHFAAAKTYGLVALGAVAVGAGIGAAGGLGGRKDKSSGGNDSKQNPSEYFSGNNSDDRSMNYLRQSQNSQADRQNMILGDKINQFVSAVETFDKKVNSTKPGDVFVAGANQNRGIFAERTTQEIGRNSTAAGQMGRRLGMK